MSFSIEKENILRLEMDSRDVEQGGYLSRHRRKKANKRRADEEVEEHWRSTLREHKRKTTEPTVSTNPSEPPNGHQERSEVMLEDHLNQQV